MKFNIGNILHWKSIGNSHRGFLHFLIAASLFASFSCNAPHSRQDKDQNKESVEKNEWKNPIELAKRKENLENAKREVIECGIPEFQRKWYVKDTSERAFYNITPVWYWDIELNLDRQRRFENNLGRNPDELLYVAKGDTLSGYVATKDSYYQIPKRDDAFLLYLWIPQRHNSFGISDYQPSHSEDKMRIYFKPNYWSDEMKQKAIEQYFEEKKWKEKLKYQSYQITNERPPSAVFEVRTDSMEKAGISPENPVLWERIFDNALGDFKISEGVDERWHYLSIYDRRDLNPFSMGKGSSTNGYGDRLLEKVKSTVWYGDTNADSEISSLFWAGCPFEIYDRMYYDPATQKLIKE